MSFYHSDLCGSRAQSQTCLSYAEMKQSVRSKHLGSASWITDSIGIPIQHLQYLPYGEPYINQHPFGYSERFTFTGKEKDEETGYGYFGARYMDHELMTMWLSVDPMADKYPSISPYAYCAWNPVKLVDPDGRDVWEVDKNGHVKNVGSEGGDKTQTIKYANGQTATFSGEYYKSILIDLNVGAEKEAKLSDGTKTTLSKSEESAERKTAMGYLFLSLADNTDVEWSIQKYKGGKYTISTLHLDQKSASPQTLGKKMSDLITIIHSHPYAQPNAKDELSSMGLFTKDGTYSTLWETRGYSDYGIRKRHYPKNVNYYIYMKHSHNIYSLGKGQWPINKGKVTKSMSLPW